MARGSEMFRHHGEMTIGDHQSEQDASSARRHSSRRHRLIRLTVLLLVGVGSAVAYVALTATINGLPPYHPFNGWVAVLQPSNERGGDQVSLEVASEASAFPNGHPLVGYTVTVCGSHAYTGELLIGGDAKFTSYVPLPPPAQGEPTPTVHRLSDLAFELGGQSPGYDLGAVQDLPIRLNYVPPCVAASGSQGEFGEGREVMGYISAPIQQSWMAPFQLWLGPVASQAWPLTGEFPGPPSGVIGQFTAISGLRGSWDRAAPLYLHVYTIDLPLTETINSALPATTDPSTLDWRGSNSLWPLARLTDTNYLSNLQTGTAICTVFLTITGAWLATLTFEWLNPRRSSAAAPTNIPSLAIPLQPAKQPQSMPVETTRSEDDQPPGTS
jgi:hypothetical protein